MGFSWLFWRLVSNSLKSPSIGVILHANQKRVGSHMCKSPKHIKRQVGTRTISQPVACKKYCSTCRVRAENDLVGRALGEQHFSDQTLMFTMTYRDQTGLDIHKTESLHRPDVTLFLKNLRNSGHSIRYIGSGEHGALNGRAHFHLAIFFRGKPFEYPAGKNIEIDEWKHGFVKIDKVTDPEQFRYCIKYVNKRAGTKEQLETLQREEPTMRFLSTQPALGHEFFQEMALQHVASGVVPRAFDYWPVGLIRTEKNKKHRYVMNGTIKAQYVATFVENWEAARGPLDLMRCSEVFAVAVDRYRKDKAKKAYEAEEALDPDQLERSRRNVLTSLRRRPTDAQVARAIRESEREWAFYASAISYD